MTKGELEFNNRPFVKHRTDNRTDRDDYGTGTAGRNQFRKNFGSRDNRSNQQQGGSRDNRNRSQPGGNRESGNREGGGNRDGSRDNRSSNNNNRNFKKRY